MKPGDINLAADIEARLQSFDQQRPLPGIHSATSRNCLLEQLIDSIRRIKYVTCIRDRQYSYLVADTLNGIFDPLKAAVWYMHQDNINEAFWLVFLSVHFGKNKKTGWNLVQDVYCGLGSYAHWTWQETSSNVAAFREWLNMNQAVLKENGKFGNHHKYQSLDAYSDKGTGAAIASYIEWIGEANDHALLIREAIDRIGNEPRQLFDYLYRSMNVVRSFGRMARFDYLTMIGKLGLAPIQPGSTYMKGATGPVPGAKLLFGGDMNAPLSRTTLEQWLGELEAHLNLYFGMQVLEDALCNWQKSPENYIHFKG